MIDPELRYKIAARGRAIVHTNERYRANRNTLADVLLDLLHYADADGLVNFDAELEIARRHFKEDME